MSGQQSRISPCTWSHSGPQVPDSPPTAQSTPSNSTSPSPTFPATLKYKDPNLTGCFAGTGGSTTFTLSSGDILTFGPPSYSSTTIGLEPQTFNFSCAEVLFELRLPWRLKKSFARSPACASFARDLNEYAISAESSSIPYPQNVIPNGVYNGNAHLQYNCCGGCELHVPEIQVLYWSTSSQMACSQPNQTKTSDAILLLSSNGTQIPTNWGQSDLATYTVLDGSTLTFPSTYLVVHGAVSVRDRCGVRGKTYTNPTIAVPQGGLSTLSIGYGGVKPSTGAYDPAACRTWGFSDGSTTWFWSYDGSGSSSWASSLYYSLGPPYNPILLPPPHLTALDPEWQACTAWRNLDNDYGDALVEGLGYIYDPPRALARASAIVDPSTTKTDLAPQPTHASAQPAGSIPPAAPRVTDKPTAVANSGLSPDPSLDPVESDDTPTLNADPETKSPESAISGGDPTVATDPDPPEDGSDPMASETDLAAFIIHPFQPIANENHGGGDPATQTRIISLESSGSDPPILTIGANSYTANKDSKYVVDSQTISVGGPAIQVSGVLYSLASPTTTPPNMASIQPALPSNDEPVLTIDGKPYTVDSASQYIIGSQTLAPGGPTITVNNVPYAIPASSAAIIISDGSAIALDQKAAAADATLLSEPSAADFDTNHQPQVYTVDGIQMTGGPSTLAVGSATLAPGSPALTLSGHTLSLGTEGALVVDGHTSILTPVALEDNNKPFQTYTIDNIRLTGNAAALVIGSATLAPGSPALTISGHTLSLLATEGGALVVDGRTSTLAASGLGSNQPIQTYTVNGIPLTGNPTDLLVGSTTLTAGEPALTISGHVVSLATGGTLVVDGRTTILSADVSLASLDNGNGAVGTFSATAASVAAGGNGGFVVDYTGGTNHAAEARKMLQMLILLICLTVSIL